jgi:hypothetical protein
VIVTSSGDELRMLRERAYGPSADIHDDPAALARLRELEAATTVPEPVPQGLAGAPDAAATASVDLGEPEVQNGFEPQPEAASEPEQTPGDPDTPADPPADAEAPKRSGLSRRTKLLWAGSVVVALIVGAAITMTTSSFGAGRVAVLAEADLSDWPTETFGDPQEGSRVFDSFDGLRVLVVPNAWGNPEAGVTCVFVVQSRESGAETPSGEILTMGCGNETQPATASFAVNETAPEELRNRFPVGTALRVVLEGDEVHVFARAGAPAPAPTP